jgi:uncharacterized membrane protein YozB (DUF420 family)
MSNRLKQWIILILFVGIFIFIGYNRIQLKHVSLSVAFLLPFSFIFVIFLYRYIKKEMMATKKSKNE